MTLPVIAANLHNSRHAAGWLRDHAALFDVGLVSEAQKRRRTLATVPGRDYFTGPRSPGRNMTQETGILLASRLPDLGHAYSHISDPWPPADRVAPERWGQVVATRYRGVPIDCISLHPVAGPSVLADRDRSQHPLVERYRAAHDWLHVQVAASRRLGHEVVIGGDVQLHKDDDVPWSVHTLIRHWGFDSFAVGIDVIAWSAGLEAVRPHQEHRIGSDHPLLRVQLDATHRRIREAHTA